MSPTLLVISKRRFLRTVRGPSESGTRDSARNDSRKLKKVYLKLLRQFRQEYIKGVSQNTDQSFLKKKTN